MARIVALEKISRLKIGCIKMSILAYLFHLGLNAEKIKPRFLITETIFQFEFKSQLRFLKESTLAPLWGFRGGQTLEKPNLAHSSFPLREVPEEKIGKGKGKLIYLKKNLKTDKINAPKGS